MGFTINDIPADEYRKREAVALGLPEDATFEAISECKMDRLRKIQAAKAGLPETATWKEVYDQQFSAIYRECAKRRGLPETATEDEIIAYDRGIGVTHDGKALRLALARDFGLPDDTSWNIIREHCALAEAQHLAGQMPHLPPGTFIITP